ncbi:F-box only protein 42-like [Liolophura sinensis]|uniref:F-box only protein 42-like n=1 Tax=Liolophura sinensis TaxID=3198878 RepID=UPI00315923E1
MLKEDEISADGLIRSLSINDLPEEILEQIIQNLSPYHDLKAAREVCKQWHRLVEGVMRQMQQSFNKAVREASVVWQPLRQDGGPTIAERYSHCACYTDKSMYVFGGCTSTSTTFNDLWRVDLSSRQWIRPLAMGTYPSPKACASMVVYKDELVLFGGWNHPSPYPLHQAPRFFNELHTYSLVTNRWSHLFPQTSPRPCAGHSACVVQDKMVVFGGCHSPGLGCNDTWVYDFVQKNWEKQNTTLPQPVPRYGQSQLTIDESHILIIGGCGGPNQIFNDLWLLSLTGSMWTWSEVTVNCPANSPSQLWSHPACKVGDCAVVLSRTNKVIKSPSQDERQGPTEHHVPAPQAPVNARSPRVRVERVWIPPREENLPLPDPQGDPSDGVSHDLERNTSDLDLHLNTADPGSPGGPRGCEGNNDWSHSHQGAGSNGSLGVGSKRKLSASVASTYANSQDSSSDEGTGSLRVPLSRNLRHCQSKTTSRFAFTGSSSLSDNPTPGTSSQHDNDQVPSSHRGHTHSPTTETSRQQVRRFCGLSLDSSPSSSGLPGIRPGLPSVRPNAMKNRSKQLDALRRHADRIKQHLASASDQGRSRDMGLDALNQHVPHNLGRAAFGRREVSPPSPVTKDPKSPMFVHVLDLSRVVCHGEATWQQTNERILCHAPEETVFYSLAAGRGELLMFGGIQKDLSSMQIGADIDSHVVSNDLYVISMPKPSIT